jgi:hypothetical protein
VLLNAKHRFTISLHSANFTAPGPVLVKLFTVVIITVTQFASSFVTVGSVENDKLKALGK